MMAAHAAWLVLLGATLGAAYDRIAGYAPASLVTDYNALDGDQERIHYYLEEVTPSDYSRVYLIYTRGGHSKATASLTMPSGTSSIEYGDAVSGANLGGSSSSTGTSVATGDVTGVYGDTVRVKYTVPTAQSEAHAGCLVGGLAPSEYITDGCFNITGGITIDGTTHYPTSIDNTLAGRTLQGFSTTAGQRLRSCSIGCPYWLFMQYANFYGVDDFGDKFVLGALGKPSNGYTAGPVGFASHDMDFTDAKPKARFELIEKGIMFLNVWMYVYRMLEVAADQCVPDCIACNDKAVRSWDAAVAFYTGSREGEAGDLENGVFPHNQADKRCHNFLTCGPAGGMSDGASMVNHKIFGYMQQGQSNLLMGDCASMRPLIRLIVAQMTIPLVQGTIRYAQIVSRTGSNAPTYPEKARAEGTAFASAVVPRIAACPDGADDAELIWGHLRHGSSTIDHPAIKAALERHYGCLNITCEEVGGFFDSVSKQYNPDSEPCAPPSPPSQPPEAMLEDSAIIAIIAAGAGAALCLVCTIVCVCYLVRQEKKGLPVFTALDGPPAKPGAKPSSQEMSAAA